VLLFVDIKGCDFPLYSHRQGQTFPRSVYSSNSTDCSRSVTIRLVLFPFSAAVRYAQVSLPAGCTMFVFNVYYNAATCFGHIFWPSSGSHKFDRSKQHIWQIVTDVCLLIYIYIYIIITQQSISVYKHSVFVQVTHLQYLNVGFSNPV
jgi:hypothetical protein